MRALASGSSLFTALTVGTSTGGVVGSFTPSIPDDPPVPTVGSCVIPPVGVVGTSGALGFGSKTGGVGDTAVGGDPVVPVGS